MASQGYPSPRNSTAGRSSNTGSAIAAGPGGSGSSNSRAVVYQIDFTAVASGKRIASTKRRVRWRFGLANPEALAAGLTGTDCRGEEHDVTLVWSLTSGKRLVLADGQEVHYSNSRSNLFDYSWTMKGNHILKIVAHASPPLSPTPGFRQYEFFVNGQSFFSFPKVFRLGLSAHDPRAAATSPVYSTRMAESSFRSTAAPRRNDSGDIVKIEAPANPDEEELYLQEAIRQSLEDEGKSPPETSDLLDFDSSVPALPPLAATPFSSDQSLVSDPFASQSASGTGYAGAIVATAPSSAYAGYGNPYDAPPANPGASSNAFQYTTQNNTSSNNPYPYTNPYSAAPTSGMASDPSNLYGAVPNPASQTVNSYGAAAPTKEMSNPYEPPNAANQMINPYGPPKYAIQATNPYGPPNPTVQTTHTYGPPNPSAQATHTYGDTTNPYGQPAQTATNTVNPYASQASAAANLFNSPPQVASTNPYGAPASGYPSSSSPWTTPEPINTQSSQTDPPSSVTPQAQPTPSSLGFGSPDPTLNGFSPFPPSTHQREQQSDNGQSDDVPAPAPVTSKADQAYAKLANLDTFSLVSKNDDIRSNPFENPSSYTVGGDKALADLQKNKQPSKKDIMRTPAPPPSSAMIMSHNQNFGSYGSQYGLQQPVQQSGYGQPSVQQPGVGQASQLYGQQQSQYVQQQQQQQQPFQGYSQQPPMHQAYGPQPPMQQGYGQPLYGQQPPMQQQPQQSQNGGQSFF